MSVFEEVGSNWIQIVVLVSFRWVVVSETGCWHVRLQADPQIQFTRQKIENHQVPFAHDVGIA